MIINSIASVHIGRILGKICIFRLVNLNELNIYVRASEIIRNLMLVIKSLFFCFFFAFYIYMVLQLEVIIDQVVKKNWYSIYGILVLRIQMKSAIYAYQSPKELIIGRLNYSVCIFRTTMYTYIHFRIKSTNILRKKRDGRE